MRILLLGLVGLLASATVSLTEDAPYHAGFLALEVEAEAPFAVGVWYPARADETTWRTGFYAITAARDAQPAPGRFPLIVPRQRC
jgi:hypothetical protein